MRSDALATVLEHPAVWRRSRPAPRRAALATGWDALDALLPDHGWPASGLCELLLAHDGLGEMELLMPALRTLARRQRRIVWVCPPYLPYPPALAARELPLQQVSMIAAPPAQAAWAMEQCLRAGCCGAVLGWLPRVDYRQLRRLQIAADGGAALAFLTRPLGQAGEASPAALRLRIYRKESIICVDVLKSKGSFVPGTVLHWRACG